MPEILDESSQLESTTVAVHRTAAVVKGGRRFSFGALVVVGDRRGRVGYGYAKGNEVPNAIEKAQKYARRRMMGVPMIGRTIPHAVEGRFSSSRVRLIPAAPGTGVVAGQSVRAVLELAGITDCLTKCFGSTNSVNVIKAALAGLEQLRSPGDVARIRGVELPPNAVQVMMEKNAGFATMPVPAPKPREEERSRPGRGRGGGRGGRGGRGPGRSGGGRGGPSGPSGPSGAGGESGGGAAGPSGGGDSGSH